MASGGGSTGTEVLALTVITPAQTSAGDATSVFPTDAGFGAGVKVLIGGRRVEGVELESAGMISAPQLSADTVTPAFQRELFAALALLRRRRDPPGPTRV